MKQALTNMTLLWRDSVIGGMSATLTAAGVLAVAASAFAASPSLLDEVRDADEAADMAVASIRTPQVLESRQCVWRKYWFDALGGMLERTPLNARVTGTVECDGFRLENIVFESQPGVLVTAHLAIPTGTTGVSPVAVHRPPVVLMPLGHSNDGILNPRYAVHLAMTARAGFARGIRFRRANAVRRLMQSTTTRTTARPSIAVLGRGRGL